MSDVVFKERQSTSSRCGCFRVDRNRSWDLYTLWPWTREVVQRTSILHVISNDTATRAPCDMRSAVDLESVTLMKEIQSLRMMTEAFEELKCRWRGRGGAGRIAECMSTSCPYIANDFLQTSACRTAASADDIEERIPRSCFQDSYSMDARS